MNKIIEKINIKKFLVVFLLIQPIIDLVTSLSVRFNFGVATLGILIKGFFLAFIIFITLFKYKYKERRISTIFLIIFCVYEIIYLALNYYIKGMGVIPGEIKGSIKAFFAPLVIVFLYDIFKNEKFNIKSRYFAYIIIEYLLLIFLANITGTSFNTYVGEKQGSMGWFYAGNDIGAVLISLFPILYFYTIKSNSKFLILFLFLAIYIIFGIGTKVSVLGILLILLGLFIISILNYLFKKDKIKLKKNLVLSALLLVFASSLIPNSTFLANIKLQYSNLQSNISENKENISDSGNKTNDQEVLNELLFSGRTEFKKHSQERYNNSYILEKLFGMGYINKKGGEYKLVEIDQYDLFYNHGLIGISMYFSIILLIIYKFLKLIIKKDFTKLFRMNIEVYILSILLLFVIGFYSGHVLLNPTVSLYLSFIILVAYFKIYNLYSPIKRIKNNKVTIMALHLKYGGIEKFISMTSQFLSEKFDVEIVSVYKYPEKEIIDISKEVKIKYLLKDNEVPNKEIIKSCIKNKKYLSIIKESLIATKILILKNLKMINYIKNCDSGIIISTRMEHNSILSEYSDESTIRIATEHNYYNEKYSKKIANSCGDVDYFIVSTELQKAYYEELFKGNKLTVLKIPFALENIPNKTSKLNNYNLVSIGRLSKEKGYLDLIEIFNKLSLINSKYKLTIIGEGNERKVLEKKIKEYRLEKKVKLVGAKNKKEITKILLNSSLYLMTSHIESFGIVLIEAMSCGVPCIIFDSAKGACEIIKNNSNGFIINDRDKEKYVEKIEYLINNREKLIAFGKTAKEDISIYSIDKIKQEWINVLKLHDSK